MSRLWKRFLSLAVVFAVSKQTSSKGLTTITWQTDPTATMIFGQSTTPYPRNNVNKVTDLPQMRPDIGSAINANVISDKTPPAASIGTRDPLLHYDHLGNSVSGVYDTNTNTATSPDHGSSNVNDARVGDTSVSSGVNDRSFSGRAGALSSGRVADGSVSSPSGGNPSLDYVNNMAAGNPPESTGSVGSSTGSVDPFTNTVEDKGMSGSPSNYYIISGATGTDSGASSADISGNLRPLGLISDSSGMNHTETGVRGGERGMEGWVGISNPDHTRQSAVLVGGAISFSPGMQDLGNQAATGEVGKGPIGTSSQDPFQNTETVGDRGVAGSTDYYSNSRTGNQGGSQYDHSVSFGTDPYSNTAVGKGEGVGVGVGDGLSGASFSQTGQVGEMASPSYNTDQQHNTEAVSGGIHDTSGYSSTHPGNTGLGETISGTVATSGNTATPEAIYDTSVTSTNSEPVGQVIYDHSVTSTNSEPVGQAIYDHSVTSTNSEPVGQAIYDHSVTSTNSEPVGQEIYDPSVTSTNSEPVGQAIYDPSVTSTNSGPVGQANTDPSTSSRPEATGGGGGGEFGFSGTHPFSNTVGERGGTVYDSSSMQPVRTSGQGGTPGVSQAGVGTTAADSEATVSSSSTTDPYSSGVERKSAGATAVDQQSNFKKLFPGQSGSMARMPSGSMGQLTRGQIQALFTKLRSVFSRTTVGDKTTSSQSGTSYPTWDRRLQNQSPQSQSTQQPIPRQPIPRQPIPRQPIRRQPIPRQFFPRQPIPRQSIPRRSFPQHQTWHQQSNPHQQKYLSSDPWMTSLASMALSGAEVPPELIMYGMDPQMRKNPYASMALTTGGEMGMADIAQLVMMAEQSQGAPGSQPGMSQMDIMMFPAMQELFGAK